MQKTSVFGTFQLADALPFAPAGQNAPDRHQSGNQITINQIAVLRLTVTRRKSKRISSQT
jgi:hypothetical protein